MPDPGKEFPYPSKPMPSSAWVWWSVLWLSIAVEIVALPYVFTQFGTNVGWIQLVIGLVWIRMVVFSLNRERNRYNADLQTYYEAEKKYMASWSAHELADLHRRLHGF